MPRWFDPTNRCQRIVAELRWNKLVDAFYKSTEHFKTVLELFEENEQLFLLVNENIYGHNCFTKTCIFVNFEVVQMLIEQYQYDWISSRDLEGNTIINILAERGNLRILKHLLSVSPDISEQHQHLALKSSLILNDKGWSFLSHICSNRNYSILKFLLKGKENSLMQQVFPFAEYGRHYIDCLILALTSEKQNNSAYNSLLSFVQKKII